MILIYPKRNEENEADIVKDNVKKLVEGKEIEDTDKKENEEKMKKKMKKMITIL